MTYNKNELNNISNSLKHWNISEAQKECVNQLIKQAEKAELYKESLKSIHDTIVFSPKDWSLDNRDAWIWGIACGWDDENYKELSSKFGWNTEDIKRNKRLHIPYR